MKGAVIMISLQVVYVLLIIISVYILLSFYIINKFKNINGQNIGPKLKQDLNNLQLKNTNDNTFLLKNLISSPIENAFIIFAESNCSECKKVLDSMMYLKKSVMLDIQVVFSNTNENREGSSKYTWLPNKFFVDLDSVINDLSIHMFPYFIETNSKGLVESKGFASVDSLLEFIKNNDKIIVKETVVQ